jgi:hypothetical protein
MVLKLSSQLAFLYSLAISTYILEITQMTIVGPKKDSVLEDSQAGINTTLQNKSK